MSQSITHNPKLELTFLAELDTVEGILALVQEWAHHRDVSYDDRLSLRLVLEELLSNICLHSSPIMGQTKVILSLHPIKKTKNIQVLICDNGTAFNPLEQYTQPVQDLQNAPLGQQGLSFVRLLTHGAQYTRNEGNELSFIFSLDEESSSQIPSHIAHDTIPKTAWEKSSWMNRLSTLWNEKLAFRQTILFTFYSIVLIWGGIAIFYYDTQRTIKENATQLAMQTLHTQSVISSSFLKRLQDNVDRMVLSLQEEPVESLFAHDLKKLTHLIENDPITASIIAEIPVIGLVAGCENTTWFYPIIQGTMSKRSYIQNLNSYVSHKGEEILWKTLPMTFEKGDPHAAMIYAVPLSNKGAQAGFVGVIITMPWIANTLNKLSGLQNINTFYLDHTGQYVIFPHGRKLNKGAQNLRDEAKIYNIPQLALIEKDILAGKKGMHILEHKISSSKIPWELPWETPTILAYFPMQTTGWFLGFLADSHELGTPSSSFPLSFLLVAIWGPLSIACITWTVTSLTLKPLRSLLAAMEKLRRGDTETPFPTAPFPDELHLMLQTFESIRVTLRTSFRNLVENTAKQQRLTDELIMARKTQQSMLPKSLPQVPGTEVAACLDMAQEVCGDLYTSFQNPHNPTQIYFVIGDVCNKGIPAALIMSRAVSLARSFLMLPHSSPAKTLESLNTALLHHDTSAMFVSMLVASLDTQSGIFQWASAGHPPPIISDMHAHEGISLPWSKELVLNVCAGQKYTTFTEQLSPQQSILLYTDGADEAISPPNRVQGQLYGEKRLRESFHDACQQMPHAQDILNKVHADILRHTGDMTPGDDISLMVIHWKGAT